MSAPLTKAKLLEFLHRLGSNTRIQALVSSPEAAARFSRDGARARSMWTLNVTSIIQSKLATKEDLLGYAEAIRPQINRYPAVDEESFLKRVREFVEGPANV